MMGGARNGEGLEESVPWGEKKTRKNYECVFTRVHIMDWWWLTICV